ncbi:glutathionylspermidine synthase family protein [Paenibacillus turpanensis]|uniref:glutathionylspermidine synthase family protein n=1 Tax=Paenibacillus turpanensis TaxID=2689078 RepID=UPI00140BD11E|nr:glutathionylspermidine synthase family protein [Paenibacillus turpanensis]
MTVFEVIGRPDPQRSRLVEELGRLGFTWADMEGDPYWIDQLVVMRKDVYQELQAASEKLWTIFDKTVRFVHGSPEFYKELAIPEVLWASLDLLPLPPAGQISRYARFDFSISQDGAIKLFELNADTPTGYVEASVVTPWMCERLGAESVNGSMPGLVQQAWQSWKPEAMACVAYGQHLEDSGTIDMLAKHSGLPVRMLDCLDLWVDEGILKSREGDSIGSLYALYPKEWMAVDEGGEALAYAVETARLQLYNPVHAILLQSKGLQAVIWGLHELRAPIFSEEEHRTISQYMLPTYNMPVLEANYVSKSMFGREGGSVRMYDKDGQLDVEDEEGYDTSEMFDCVYQQRAELPKLSFAEGRQLHLLTGMFVINGVPCGLLGRAGGLITGNSSHFAAIGVK